MATYPGVYIEGLPSGPRPIEGVATSVAAFVDAFERGPLDEPVRCTSYAECQLQFGASCSVGQFFENGGKDAWVVRVHGDLAAGIHAPDKVDLFNVLCLPGAADLPLEDMQAAYAAAIEYCERRRAFLIVDIPKDVATPARMQAWLIEHAHLRHRNAAVYFPRTLVSDPLDHSRPPRDCAASGTIA